MFQKSWFSAEKLLLAAENWIFISYSLPAADFEFKYLEWSNNSDDCEGGGTVHEGRALPENRTLHPKADRNSRFQTLHITELVTFRRVTLPEKPWLLLM